MSELEKINLSDNQSENQKGTVTNPFQIAEYESLASSNAWEGGYVYGLGFVEATAVE